MSRIGQEAIEIPSGVTVEVNGSAVSVKGALGDLALDMRREINAKVEDGKVVVGRIDDSAAAKGFHGLTRTLIANMIEGVSKGFTKDLEIQGVGFKAVVQGQKLMLSLGFASPIEYSIPDGITIKEEGGTKVNVSGRDKALVGTCAARIRSFFPAEPYKGKGVRYLGEHVRRKAGKTVA